MTKPKKNISRDQIREIPVPDFRDARKTGHPKIFKSERELRNIVYELAMIQCTLEEIGHILQVDATTIMRRYKDIMAYGRDHGHMSLRRMQFRKAMEGSVPMLIWLGKIWLNQKDTEGIQATSLSEAQQLFKKWEDAGAARAIKKQLKEDKESEEETA